MGESSSSSLSLTQQIGVAPLLKRLSKHLTRKFAKIFFILSNHKSAGSLGALGGFVIASVFAWKFVRATAGQRRRQKQTSDAAVESTKVVLGQTVKNKLNGARKMTCQLLGVILEESSPEELQHHATLRPSVVEMLLEISRFCDIYLIERILDDESGERVLLALENTGLFQSGGLMKDKVLFCRASTSDSEGNQDPGSSTRWNGFFHMLKKGPNVGFQKWKSVPKLTRRKNQRIREEMVPALRPSIDGELCYFKSCWKNFTLSELEAATNNFSHDNLIGEGGYAEVYKGAMEDGQLVAIKRLTRGTQEEMTADFLSELGVIVHVDHPNIAKLIGYGVEGGMHLVLELSPHGSLASVLYGPREKLDWGIRHKIALGIAKGLVYLHEGCHRRIIHKDIKASNILLAEDFEPQISDFGLAKWLPDQWTHHTVSNFEGTFGYLPPEYFMHGIVDEKTDVYSYGVLILELITGRKALDSSQQSLVMWAKPLLSKNCILELVDPFLADAYDSEQMNCMALTASLCIHPSSIHRPQMSEVEKILKGDAHTLASIKQCQQSKFQRTYSEELSDAEEYNSTKYLKDLGRYREIVLGPSNDA